MSNKPIFVATHPRACSTAFERVFMTQHDTLNCIHEPFGDAFYYGPERLSERYEHDEKERIESGFSESTYKTVLDRIEREASEGKRLFIKDITHYLVPPNGKPASIAPSLVRTKKGVGTENGLHATHQEDLRSSDAATVEPTNGQNGHATQAPYPYHTEAEPGNPTVIPSEILGRFHFTFLIRHPRSSIPSYYRCTVPPLDDITGFYDFMPSEAGYDEVRRVFDYLRTIGQIGPEIAGRSNSNDRSNGAAENGHANAINGTIAKDKVEICVIDADDLLDNPTGIISAYCKSVGVPYSDSMLKWDTPEDQARAKAAFEKWKGFHEDAIHSSQLKPRDQKSHTKRDASAAVEDVDAYYDSQWREKYGEKGATIIRQAVDANLADYEYMKRFALKV